MGTPMQEEAPSKAHPSKIKTLDSIPLLSATSSLSSRPKSRLKKRNAEDLFHLNRDSASQKLTSRLSPREFTELRAHRSE